MDLRNIFTTDLISDHPLIATMVFCMVDMRPVAESVLYRGQAIQLRPYEVLLPWDRIQRDFQMSPEEFRKNIKILQSLGRVTVKEETDFAKIRFHNLSFPINPVQEIQKPGEQIVSIKLDRWIEIDLEWAKNNVAARTQEMIRLVLNRYLKLIGNKKLAEIDKHDYREFVSILKNKGVKDISINDYRRALHASLERAITAGYLKENVIKAEKPLPVCRNRAKILETDEIKVLLDNSTHPWLKDVIEFALLSAKRHGEILNLVWSDIDWEEGLISIHSSATYHTKFGKEQTLPLTSALRELLRKIQDNHREREIETDYIFIDERGKPLKKRRIQNAMSEIRELTGLGDHVTIHALRRTAATMLKRQGVSTNTIRGLLNHENDRTTEKYLGVPRSDEIDALNKLTIPGYLQ